ncbi:MAG: hypothetical protein EXQ85_03300 [Alphaproteobacteria bacterium]|nr:hypothetical protein [Alphaproteobacteria bacterium]
MAELATSVRIPGNNPIDLLEQIVAANEWAFDRYADDEMNVGIEGSLTRYHLWFAWREEQHSLQISCAFDLKVSREKVSPMHSLLALMNEKMWLGHFDLWAQEGLLMYRHAQLYTGGASATPEQMEELVSIALRECERFYPAIQFVLWGGKGPAEAVAAAMLETEGEA